MAISRRDILIGTAATVPSLAVGSIRGGASAAAGTPWSLAEPAPFDRTIFESDERSTLEGTFI
jgi:hypothetical protein